MYQALYRKWRPRTFDDVVGQDHITTTLRRQVETGRLSHAYLFIGTRGTGKTTCAKILARAVNCEHPVNGSPCNCCPSCLGIENGSIMDVVEMDAASNNRVDDVRALQDEAIFTPGDVKKRVYIIDEVHMLTPAAFNALLKILEEPPEHLMFILCTTELHKVLPTIVSRCQRHSFKRIDADTIAKRLLYVAGQEGMQLDQDAADTLAGLADGGMRDALSLLDQCSAQEHIDLAAVHSALGLAGAAQIENLMRAVLAHDTGAALGLFTELWRGGKDPSGILNELSGLMRDVLLVHTAGNAGSLLSGLYGMKSLKEFAAAISPSDLMDELMTVRDTDLAGADPRRAAEICLVRLCRPETGDSVRALKKRISVLENALESLRQNGSIPVIPGAVPGAMPAAPVYTPPAPVYTPPAPVVSAPPAPKTPEPVPAPPEPEAPPAPSESEPPPYGDDDVPPMYSDDDIPPEPGEPQYFEPAPEPAPRREAPAPRPEPAPVPKAPEPVSPAQPRAAQTAPAGATDAAWPQLLQSLQGALRIDMAALLNNSDIVGLLAGNKMTIYAGSTLRANLLKANDTAFRVIQKKLSELIGGEALLEVSDAQAPAVPHTDALPVFSAPAAPAPAVRPEEAPAQTEPAPDAPVEDAPAPAEEAPAAEPDPLDELKKFPVVRFVD